MGKLIRSAGKDYFHHGDTELTERSPINHGEKRAYSALLSQQRDYVVGRDDSAQVLFFIDNRQRIQVVLVH